MHEHCTVILVLLATVSNYVTSQQPSIDPPIEDPPFDLVNPPIEDPPFDLENPPIIPPIENLQNPPNYPLPPIENLQNPPIDLLPPIENLQNSPIDLLPPIENLQNPPIDLQDPTPIDLQDPTPIDLQDPAPIDLQNPTPIGLQNPAPIDLQDPTPIDLQDPTPIDLQDPTPIDLLRPEPINLEEPPMPLDLGRPNEYSSAMSGGDEALYMSDLNMPRSMLGDDGKIVVDGDMRLTKDQYENLILVRSPENRKRAAGIKEGGKNGRYHYWPNATMPFDFNAPGEREFSNYDRYMIGRAMTDWERYTCMFFQKATGSEKNRVTFTRGQGGCSSELGMYAPGRQHLYLGAPGCRFKGLYLHEIGHAIGLIHEQSRPDRDQYIEIHKENVDPILRQWFNKYPAKDLYFEGVPYEYSSIMHYGIEAFTMTIGQQTIVAKDKSREKEISKVYLKELAYSDVLMVNKMYKCSAHCPNKNKCGPDGHLDENCNCICSDGSSNCDQTKKDKPGRDCKNKFNDWKCYIFANQGECERNIWWMSNNCARACAVCGPKPAKPSSCKDVYPDKKCKTWLSRGDCITNKVWMGRFCPVTCNLCTDKNRPEENCENKYKFPKRCDDKAADGDCTWDPVGMWTNCRRSCGWCNKGQAEVNPGDYPNKWDEKQEECKDETWKCAGWAKDNQCLENPPYMVKNCKKSCHKCNDGTCKNLNDDRACKKKADNGDCVTNPYFMNIQCAWACRRGPCEGVVTPPTTPAPITEDPNCRDAVKTKTCASWLKRIPSYCSRLKSYTQCQKTCGYCGPCEDKDPECESLAATRNYCRNNAKWMLSNCPKACKVCR